MSVKSGFTKKWHAVGFKSIKLVFLTAGVPEANYWKLIRLLNQSKYAWICPYANPVDHTGTSSYKKLKDYMEMDGRAELDILLVESKCRRSSLINKFSFVGSQMATVIWTLAKMIFQSFTVKAHPLTLLPTPTSA